MRFKKVALASSLSFLVGTIVVPVSLSVNRHKIRGMQVADGTPLPLPPRKDVAGVLVADGTPLPLPPRKEVSGVLVADGTPLPLPPRQVGNSATVA
jgi:hypothetical protein